MKGNCPGYLRRKIARLVRQLGVRETLGPDPVGVCRLSAPKLDAFWQGVVGERMSKTGLAVDAGLRELFSALKFPVNREKYREIAALVPAIRR